MNHDPAAGSSPQKQISCSLIIPAYNAERYIAQTLDSVVAQTMLPREIIVIDDGSTDATSAVVSGYEDRGVTLIRQQNQGASAARNRGMAIAQGEFVLFLDADDRLLPTAIERFSRAFEDWPHTCAAYGNARTIDQLGNPLGPETRPVFGKRPSGQVLETLLQQNFILNGAICIKTSHLKEAGFFDESLTLMEDWEFWCRLAALGPFVYIGEKPVFEYRIHPQSAMRSMADYIQQGLLAIDRVYNNPLVLSKLPSEQIPVLRKYSEAKLYHIAANQRLLTHDWNLSRRYLVQCLRRQPTRIREWILLFCALLHWLPECIAIRLR